MEKVKNNDWAPFKEYWTLLGYEDIWEFIHSSEYSELSEIVSSSVRGSADVEAPSSCLPMYKLYGTLYNPTAQAIAKPIETGIQSAS